MFTWICIHRFFTDDWKIPTSSECKSCFWRVWLICLSILSPGIIQVQTVYVLLDAWPLIDSGGILAVGVDVASRVSRSMLRR
jgi:hypothetical protein